MIKTSEAQGRVFESLQAHHFNHCSSFEIANRSYLISQPSASRMPSLVESAAKRERALHEADSNWRGWARKARRPFAGRRCGWMYPRLALITMKKFFAGGGLEKLRTVAADECIVGATRAGFNSTGAANLPAQQNRLHRTELSRSRGGKQNGCSAGTSHLF